VASLPDNLGNLAPEKLTILDFSEARDEWMAVASAGQHADHLHFTSDR